MFDCKNERKNNKMDIAIKNELNELEKRYAPKRLENSFYTDMSAMKKPAGSSKFLGNFSNYSAYYIDNASQKIMRTELK